MSERWRTVKGWPAYQISTSGRVRFGGRPVSTFANSHGYWQFNVGARPNRKMLKVHREIAKVFVAPFKGKLVRHLDGDRSNNQIHNLKWGTYQDNEADKKKHGRAMAGETHCKHKLKEFEVLEIRQSQLTTAELMDKYGVAYNTIWSARRNKTWKHLL